MLDGVVIDDTALFDDRLQEWENLYDRPAAASMTDHHRPGVSALRRLHG